MRFLRVFFFSLLLLLLFWAADVSNLSRSQLCSVWYMELDKQDTKQNTELKKSVVQSVLLCLSCIFMYILTSKFIMNWTKNKQAKKKIKASILLYQTRTEKTNARGSFETYNYFFSLVCKFSTILQVLTLNPWSWCHQQSKQKWPDPHTFSFPLEV